MRRFKFLVIHDLDTAIDHAMKCPTKAERIFELHKLRKSVVAIHETMRINALIKMQQRERR